MNLNRDHLLYGDSRDLAQRRREAGRRAREQRQAALLEGWQEELEALYREGAHAAGIDVEQYRELFDPAATDRYLGRVREAARLLAEAGDRATRVRWFPEVIVPSLVAGLANVLLSRFVGTWAILVVPVLVGVWVARQVRVAQKAAEEASERLREYDRVSDQYQDFRLALVHISPEELDRREKIEDLIRQIAASADSEKVESLPRPA